jgi:RNA polymerase sigma-70 factor, ECF subfamily
MPVRAVRSKPTPADWSDRMLLRRVLRREDRAWNELIRRYRGLIYRCITKVTTRYSPGMDNADLDEIYSEVLMCLVRNDMHKLRQYDFNRGTKLGSWLGLLSINATYDFLRGSSRGPMLDRIDGLLDQHFECDRTPLDVLLEKERWEHLNGLLSRFSDKDRTFLELYYGKGLEADAIADTMAISLKTVYSKKHKIRAHLRRTLERSRGDIAIADLATIAA